MISLHGVAAWAAIVGGASWLAQGVVLIARGGRRVAGDQSPNEELWFSSSQLVELSLETHWPTRLRAVDHQHRSAAFFEHVDHAARGIRELVVENTPGWVPPKATAAQCDELSPSLRLRLS